MLLSNSLRGEDVLTNRTNPTMPRSNAVPVSPYTSQPTVTATIW